MTYLFANIGYFYLALYLLTAFALIAQRTQTSFISSLYLGALTVSGWMPSLWNHPESMATFHLFIIVLMTFTMHSKMGTKIYYYVFLMFLADCSYMLVNWSLFYWQSALNILFFLILCTTLRSSWISHKNGGENPKRGPENAKFIAFQGDKVHS
jgi:hypothetical protein